MTFDLSSQAINMSEIEKVHIKDSIATRLLKIVFGIYILITLSVTIIHMVGEYLYIEDDIKKELDVLNHSFNRSITTALFNLDLEQLDQNMKGALDIPSIVGVKIVDYTTGKEIQGGIVTEEKLNQDQMLSDLGLGRFDKLFSNYKPIFSPENPDEKIGEVILFSSSEIVFSKVKLGFIFIIINSIIKTAALWIIFLIVGRRILIKPLHKLTRATQTLNIDSLENLQIDIKTTSGNELKVLETGFNKMIKKLHFEMVERIQAEARLQGIMNNTPTAIYLIDLEGKFQMINREFEIQFGVAGRDIINQTYYHIFPKETADNSVLIDVEVIQKGVPLTVEETYPFDDMKRIFMTIKFPIKDLNGMVTMVCGILTDITDRKNAEDALKTAYSEMEHRVAERTKDLQKANQDLYRANAKANAATKSKSEFLANMSHEIRTPMNGVIAAADLALNLELSPEAKKYLNIIKSSGDSLLSIINDILDISKIEAGKLELEFRPFRIDKLLDTISALFIKKLQDEKIEIAIDLDPDMPLAVIGDSLRFKQILTNLIGNAIKFTKEGGFITIGVSRFEVNELNNDEIGLACYVEDTGTGVKPENVDKLFEQYAQEEVSTTRKYGGTGLGLTICKYIVELMGGQIWVESEYGKGTTFHFNLILNQHKGKLVENDTLAPDIKNLKVLVIDDNRHSLDITQKYLQAFGCKTTLADSGQEGLARLKNAAYDLIISDWQMPELNGIDTVNIIRDELKMVTPIIMMTAFIARFDKEIARKAGVNCFLTKPINSSVLINAIMEALGKTKPQDSESEAVPPGEADIDNRELSGKRILLAEDNLTNQEIAKAVLQNTGAVIEIANNGREAVDKVLNKLFDMVLMDIQMPEMDGFEATRRIRKLLRFESLPIIAMTAHAMKGDKEKCIEAGMNDYITKPINQKELLATLSRIMSDQQDKALDGNDQKLDVSENLIDNSENGELAERIRQAYNDQNMLALQKHIQTLNQQAGLNNNVKVVNLTKNIERLCKAQKNIQKSLIEALSNELTHS